MDVLEERVRECFRAVFPTLSDDELLVLDQASTDAWDSLASLTLITVIEEEFDLFLAEDDIAEMHSFRKACEVLATRT